MTARRATLCGVLLTAACARAWGQTPPLTITPTSLPVGGGVFFVGQTTPTQQLFSNALPSDMLEWSLSSGNLPPGLNFDPVKVAIPPGIPTVAGAFTFTITVFDEEIDAQASRQYTIYVSSGLPVTLSLAAAPGGAVGSSYASFPFQAAGGAPSYTWALQSGTNVDGLTLDPATGLLSGIPLSGGVFPVGVTATDPSGAQGSASFNLNVLGITTSSLPVGALGVPYAQTLTATGSTGMLTWSLAGTGALPQGLNLSAQGQIAGTPTAYGAFPIQVHVTDTAANLTATKSFSLSITSLLTVTTASPLANGAIGVAYSQTLQATGGTAPYTWSATGLPAWLQLDPTTGILSGTPTTGGTSAISVTVTDAVHGTATASLSLTVGALTISPATLPNGTVGVPYPATTLTVAGTTVANWAVTVGTLPGGLALDSSTGVISGKPTAVGSSTFTITAEQGGSISRVPPVVQAFTLVINPLPTVTISGLPPTGVAATQSPAAVTLSGPSPVTTTGTLTLTFAPASGGTQPFDAKFASGSPYTASFTIAAGSMQGLFAGVSSVPVMIGTVAGKITITTSIQDSTLTPPAPVVMTVNPTVPVITSVNPCAITLNGFSISVTGRSTPRDMTSALFHFTLPTNTQPSTLDVTVPLTTAFTAWYSNPNSNAFGSLFKMTAQFSFTGPPGSTVPFVAVTATLTNSIGTSTPPVAGQPSVSTCP